MKSTNPTRADRILARCREIAAITDIPGETTRLFLSPSTHIVHTLIRNWMEAAAMTVHIDAIGNIRGLYPAHTPNASRLLITSHLDTVPNAGAFDGILGVLLGIAVIEELHTQTLPFAIEVIGFSEEEGVRFSKPFLGSLALIGALDAETLARKDHNGITLTQAIKDFGLDPTHLPHSQLQNESFACLEFHIEQGPVLEAEDSPLGIVEALVGQTRLELTFTGQANHAGTTPMHLRHDALAAAAAWISAVESHAKATPGLVATIGKIEAAPNAGNVIPGRVTASLDVRHTNDNIRQSAVSAFKEKATVEATNRGVSLSIESKLDQPAVPLDANLTQLLQSAAKAAGHPARLMVSGAGHDAMILAQRIPATMLFLRSPNGLSHHPDESVLPHDIEAALDTAMHFLTLLSSHAPTREAHA